MSTTTRYAVIDPGEHYEYEQRPRVYGPFDGIDEARVWRAYYSRNASVVPLERPDEDAVQEVAAALTVEWWME